MKYLAGNQGGLMLSRQVKFSPGISFSTLSIITSSAGVERAEF
jgi:hypothetical protein